MARILFIEPDRLLGANAKQILKHSGHWVDWCVDPQAAMDSADSAHPDIVILDLLLAGRSGIEFLYEFRSYPEWTRLPIIIYTNVKEEDFNSSGVGFKQLGISAYFYKPTTSISKLSKSINQILQPVTS